MTGIGLVVFIIGAVSLINIGLKVFIFTQADTDFYAEKPTAVRLVNNLDQAEALKTCDELTEDDKQKIKNWIADYQETVESEKNMDRKRAQRERQAAQAVAMILVGFPIYWIHWSLIKRDRKKEDNKIA